MKWFKIKTGYNQNDFVSIDENELELALHIFNVDGKAVFKNGVARGKDIIAIKEDWHKAMGINQAWKLNEDDYNEMAKQGIDTKYRGAITEAKERVRYLVDNKKENLIGTGIDIPELQPVKQVERTGGFKRIGEPQQP